MIWKLRILFLLIFISNLSFSQVSGTVTDKNGETLPYVNIYTEDGLFGTTTNEDGKFQINIDKTGTYEIVFQFLGYETLRNTVAIKELPYILDATLQETTTNLEEVTINSKENPANKIIKQAIENRNKNLARLEQYTANYYSRGLWRIKNAPEKILGQEVGDLGGGLDSTRSGIVYLSETISNIAFKAPDDFKETILASKVSGDDNGFSLNSARESEFSFYKNTIDLNAKIVSPIADYAFNYYTYKLEGIFYADTGQLINKIMVQPKRPNDRVFSGYIYIVDNSWQIFGVELNTTGEAIQFSPIERLTFTQNFKYSEENKFWIKISQTVDFSFAMFGISGDGRFTAVYSNYNFTPQFVKSSFSREVMSFAEKANKKDSLFWKSVRPVPLTDEELTDYVRKDSIQILKTSKKYLDSVDTAQNSFNISNLAFGYSYANSYKKQRFSISSPLFGTHFNTVQGWNTNVTISYRKEQQENSGKFWRLKSQLNYGFSEDKLRYTAEFQQKFNNFSKPVLSISGGIESAEINDTNPISTRMNDITSLFFERNYLKLYQRKFGKIAWQQEVFNGLEIQTDLSFQDRSALLNTTDQYWVNNNDVQYTSNNPLQPDNFDSKPFLDHHIFKFNLAGKINFDQNYMSYPDGKFNISSNKYPTLYLGYEKGFAADISNYNYDQFKFWILQDLEIGNKGSFGYSIKGGTFINAEDIAFVDYRHFDGNQTRIGNGSYLNKYNLLPYYQLSTNNNYLEAHAEHNFKGYILGKLPLLNKLNYNLVIGAHLLATKDNNPYTEYSVGLNNLGFGKYRFLRLDYVVSNFNGQQEGAFIFGLKFLGIFE